MTPSSKPPDEKAADVEAWARAVAEAFRDGRAGPADSTTNGDVLIVLLALVAKLEGELAEAKGRIRELEEALSLLMHSSPDGGESEEAKLATQDWLSATAHAFEVMKKASAESKRKP